MSSSKPPLAERASEPRLIDLRRIVAAARRRQWWILATVAIVLLLTAIAYFYAPRRYSATATVALDRRVDQLVTERAQPELTTDSPEVDTEVQVLTSPGLAGEVVDALGLAKRVGVGQPDDGRVIPLDRARRRAMGYVQGGLQVRRTGASYAIGITHTSDDPVLSTEIVNTLTDRYIGNQLSGRESERSRESQLLRERLASLRNDVLRAESAVASYRARTNLIDVQKDSTAVQQEMSVLNGQLATAEAERAAAEARLRAVRTMGAGTADAAGSDLIRQLRGQQAQLSAQRADLAGRYGPLHPDLARIDRQLADLNVSIRREMGRVQANAQADANVAAGRSSSIRQSLNRATNSLTAGSNASVQLNELQRNAESARTLYQALLDRYNQSVTGQGTDRSRAHILSHALVPGAPISPSLPIFVIGGILAAILASGMLVVVLEMLEGGFQSRQDVESKLGVPVVASVPDIASLPDGPAKLRSPMGPPDYLVANEGSLYGEAFRSIRTGLRLGQEAGGPRVLAVSSALPNEGKTTMSISLARSAAMSGMRVLLIDCDMRRRASTKSLVTSVEAGLVEVLQGSVPLDRAVVQDAATGAHILPQSSRGATSYDLIASPAMNALLERVARDYDLVVLDTAPVLALAEARALAGAADAVLFVVRWRKTPIHAAQIAIDLLGRSGAHIAGAALTLVNLKQQVRSGYGDEMIYYNKFKSYYT